MTTLIHGGIVERPAMRRWGTRLAHFGITGWLGLAVIAFWAAAAVFGPALLSQSGDAPLSCTISMYGASSWSITAARVMRIICATMTQVSVSTGIAKARSSCPSDSMLLR